MSEINAEAGGDNTSPGSDVIAGDAALDAGVVDAALEAPLHTPDEVVDGADGADANAAADDKGGEADGDAGAAVVPESYVFDSVELPEGMTVDQGLVESMSPVFKDIGITQEQANKLAVAWAQRADADNAASTAASAEFKKATQDTWVSALKADPEVGGPGGDDYERNTKLAAQFVSTYGDKEFKDFLETSRMGNHPSMVRMMLKAAKAAGLNEDDIGGAGEPGSKAETPLSLRMYKPDGSPLDT